MINMKKEKWLMPFVTIILFCVCLGFLTKPIVNQVNKARKQSKENEIEEEMNLAYDRNRQWEQNTSKIKDIQTGTTYTSVLKEDGTVWIAGKNKSYTGDYTYEGIQRNEWTKMRLEDIKQIAVGDNFALALNYEGEVYSWGSNRFSQLGRDTNSSKPNQIPKKLDIQNIEKIYAFGEQAAALAYDKTAYYWGYATKDYPTKKAKKFEKEKVDEIYLVQHQYYFKTTTDEIYGLGYEFDGVTTQQNGWAIEPVKVNINNVDKITSYEGYEGNSGTSQKYVIKNDGTAWLLNTMETTLETKIENIKNIKNIYPYQSTEGSSYLVLDKQGNLQIQGNVIQQVRDVKVNERVVIIQKQDGTLWNFGESIEFMKYGMSGGIPYYSIPKQILINEVELFSISNNFMLVVDKSNQLYRHGHNTEGQLGAGEEKDCRDLELE